MDIETLRAGYQAFGLGVGRATLAMFDQDFEGGGADWDVGGPRSNLVARSEVAAYDLFGGEMQGWEIVRVEPNDFVQRADRIIVTGHVFWRPKRGRNTLPVPFVHIWTLRGRRAVRVLSYLDGIELSRVEGEQS
jgi:hypothetical protein